GRAADANLTRELKLLKGYVGLSVAAADVIKQKVKPTFEENYHFEPSIPSQKVLEALVLAAEEAGCDEKLRAKYQEDLQTRLAFEQEMRMQEDVYFINAIVGLRDDQWELVRKASGEGYRKHQREYWSLTWYMDSSQPEIESLRKVLDAEQNACLDLFGPNTDDEKEAAELLKKFRLVAPMKLRQLDSIVELSESQRAKLRLAGSTTLTRSSMMQKKRLDLNDKKNWDSLMKGIPNPDLTDNEKLEVTNFKNLRLPMLFDENRWQAFVKSTLTDEQQLVWERFAKRRLQAAIDVQAFRIGNYFSELPVTGKQRRAVHELLKRSVELQESKLTNAFYRVINPNLLPVVATEAEFIAAIGEENWDQVDPFCARAMPISR
ncbi:MAG: hypothetical protein AAF394_17170, partial [Planctomycetota bacterium]